MTNLQRVQAEQPEDRDGPSLFVGLRYVTDQISLCANKIKAHEAMDAVREMNVCVASEYEAGLKVACDNIAMHCDDLAALANQMKLQATHVAGLIARHQARKPRA